MYKRQIAYGLGVGSFDGVLALFDTGRDLPQAKNRWGLLRLLQEADYGDTVTGLILNVLGRKGEVYLGRFETLDGCTIGVAGPYMYYSNLREFIHQLPEIAAAGYETRVSWRSADVQRYRLNGGQQFKDTHYTDLPDFFSLSLGFNTPLLYKLLGVEIIFSSDRYGNDYLSVGGSLQVGIGTPITGKYSESYLVGRTREWGTGYPYVPSPEELSIAITGIDVGSGASLSFLTLSEDVGVQLPVYLTGSFGVEILSLGIDFLGAGLTGSLPIDIPFTEGWAELDEIPSYDKINILY